MGGCNFQPPATFHLQPMTNEEVIDNALAKFVRSLENEGVSVPAALQHPVTTKVKRDFCIALQGGVKGVLEWTASETA
jgi:hypothetical protein